MPVRYGRFEMPKTLSKDESTATDTYAKFTAEPFEAGYGHTVGNSLRRVLLSSLEGAAITAVKITGAQHEFATLPGVVEDVTDIVLNLKRVKFKAEDHEPKKLSLSVNKEGEVTAGDIQEVAGYEVLNPKLVICTLDKKHKFDAELEVRVGRGFATGEENKRADRPDSHRFDFLTGYPREIRSRKYARWPAHRLRQAHFGSLDRRKIDPGRRATPGLRDPASSPRRLG